MCILFGCFARNVIVNLVARNVIVNFSPPKSTLLFEGVYRRKIVTSTERITEIYLIDNCLSLIFIHASICIIQCLEAIETQTYHYRTLMRGYNL